MSQQTMYKSFDLLEMELLPSNWKEDIENISELFSTKTILDGKSETSREPEDIDPIEVSVVNGKVVGEKLSWLYQLYCDHLVKLASQFMGADICVADDIVSSVNVNVLRGQGSRYEWHVDTNPVTGLLFVTEHPKGTGGELVFRLKDKNELSIYPKSGLFLVFDAREIPHTVAALTNDTTRISVPMNFFIKGVQQHRPEGLDEYLYSQE